MDNNNDNYIYLIDEQDSDYIKEKRMIEIFNKIIEGKVNIENLSVDDILNLSDYLSKVNNKLDQEIYLKNINLSLLFQKIDEYSNLQ